MIGINMTLFEKWVVEAVVQVLYPNQTCTIRPVIIDYSKFSFSLFEAVIMVMSWQD